MPLAGALKLLLEKQVSKELICPSADRHAGLQPDCSQGTSQDDHQARQQHYSRTM